MLILVGSAAKCIVYAVTVKHADIKANVCISDPDGSFPNIVYP